LLKALKLKRTGRIFFVTGGSHTGQNAEGRSEVTACGSQLAGTDQHNETHTARAALGHCLDSSTPPFLQLDENEHGLSRKTHFDHELEIGVTPAGCGG